MKRVHEYILKSSWPLAGKENPRCGPDFDIHLHFDGARQIQAVCFEAFPTVFFRISPLGITLSVVQTKWPLYTEQAIRSASACLAASLPASCLDHWWGPWSPDALFSHLCWQHNLLQGGEFHANSKAKPNAFHLAHCESVYACVCVWTF